MPLWRTARGAEFSIRAASGVQSAGNRTPGIITLMRYEFALAWVAMARGGRFGEDHVSAMRPPPPNRGRAPAVGLLAVSSSTSLLMLRPVTGLQCCASGQQSKGCGGSRCKSARRCRARRKTGQGQRGSAGRGTRVMTARRYCESVKAHQARRARANSATASRRAGANVVGRGTRGCTAARAAGHLARVGPR